MTPHDAGEQGEKKEQSGQRDEDCVVWRETSRQQLAKNSEW